MPDINSELFKQLSQFAMGPVSTPSQKTSDLDIAKQILLNSSVNSSGNWKFSNAPLPTDKGKKQGGPSTFSRIVDVLQRPEYAAMEWGKGMATEIGKGNILDMDPLGPVKAGWKGLTGEKKTLPSKMLNEADLLPENKVGKFAVGLTADILGDPLTYVGPGLVRGIGKGIKELTSADKTAAVINKAVQDAPAVSTALDQTVKTAGVAEHALSPMQAALVTKDAVKDGRMVLKAADASGPAIKTFSETMKDVLYQSRTTPQQVILKNSDAIQMRMLPVGSRGAKGRFVPNPKYITRPLPKKIDTARAIANVLKGTPHEQPVLNIASRVAMLQRGHPIPKIMARLGIKADTDPAVVNSVRSLLNSVKVAPKASVAVNTAEATTNIRNHIIKATGDKTAWRYIQISHDIQRFAQGASIDDTMAAITTRLAAFKDIKPETLSYIRSQLLASKASKVSKGKKSAYTAPVSTGIPKVVQQTTNALNGVLDEPIRVLKPGETVSEKGVTHGIMSRVATWWGQKDLRPLALDAKTSALSAAEARQTALANLFKPYTDEQILQAWDVATKIRPRDITHPDVVKLADDLTGSMELWFKSSAIPEAVAKGNSAALRSAMTIEDMNAALKRYGVDFQFTAAKDAAVKGGTHTRDFSNGTDWLNSWEGHIPETATALKKAIYGVQSAAEQVTREYGFLDDAASRFGSTVKKKGYVAIDIPRLEGWYFPAEIGDQLSLAIKHYHDIYKPSAPIAKHVASGVSAWKAGVTKYNPRHHIANIIGDSFLAWVAGMNNPIRFKQSMDLMRSQAGLYKDINTVENLVGPGAIAKSIEKPGKTFIKSKSGIPFSKDTTYIAAKNYGLLQTASAIEDLANPGFFQKIKPLGGRLSRATSQVAETREHYVKLAHFIDAISKSKGKTPTEVFEEAAHIVRKWHPDGLDLTKEEQALRTFGIPFYSWLRKSTPLLIEGALMNPKKAFLIPQHTMYNAQQAMGIEASSPSDLFPADQMFPKWLQESGIGPMGLTGAPGLAGWIASKSRQGVDDEGNPVGGYTVAGPSTPMNDLFEAYGGFTGEGIARGLVGGVNPMIRAPLEYAFGQRVFSGVPITDKSDWLTEQIPGVSQGARMTNLTPFGTSQRGAKEGVGNMEGVYNWLFNAGITGTGPYIKSAEFEDIPRQRDQNNAYREFAKQIGRPLNSKGKIPQYIKDLFHQQQGGG